MVFLIKNHFVEEEDNWEKKTIARCSSLAQVKSCVAVSLLQEDIVSLESVRL